MNASRFLSARRKGELLRCPPLNLAGPTGPVSTRRAIPAWATLLIALLFSGGLHAGVGAYVAANAEEKTTTRTVITFRNAPEPPPQPKPQEPEPTQEEPQDEPQPDSPPEDQQPQPQEPAPEPVRQPQEQAPRKPTTDKPIFGIDLDAASELGNTAVRIGNTLLAKPGKFVDPEKVKPLAQRRRPKPPPKPEPVVEEPPPVEPPPVVEDPPPAITEPVIEPPIEEPPPRKPVRVIPKEKYLTKAEPSYTEDALEFDIEGTVEIDVWFDHKGAPKRTKVVKGLGYGLDQAAVAAAMRSTFNPILIDGQPVGGQYRLKYRFEIQ